MKDRLQIRWVDLFVLPSDKDRRYAEALQLRLLKIRRQRQVAIYEPNRDVESLSPHLEFEMDLREPVHEERSHFLCYLPVLEEVLRNSVSFLLAQEPRCDLWRVFSHRLNVTDVKQITNFQVACQSPHSFLATLLSHGACRYGCFTDICASCLQGGLSGR